MPAGLRRHLLSPAPGFEEVPAALGRASTSLLLHTRRTILKGTNLLGFNENVSVGWVEHGFTDQLLCHGNRLVHGNAQIREVIQKPGGKHEPKGYQSLLRSTLKQSTSQEGNIQSCTGTVQSRTRCLRGRQGKCQNTANWLCLLLSKLPGTDCSQKEKADHIFNKAALTWAPCFSSRDSQRCQSQQL